MKVCTMAGLSEADCDFLSVPASDPRSDHPVLRRECSYLAAVKRPSKPQPVGIPDVRLNVYQICTDCPKGCIAYRRLPHYSCKHCLAGEWDECPLSFAGPWTVHKMT